MGFINEAVQWRQNVDVYFDDVGSGYNRRVDQVGQSHILVRRPL